VYFVDLDRITGRCSDTCIISHASLTVSRSKEVYNLSRANTHCLATV
jgi:hypothetical protein